MKLAVIGSRSAVNIELQKYLPFMPSAIISGGAKGIDTIAENFAKANNIPLVIFRPDYARYGKGAPLRRNEDIIRSADFVLAIWDSKSKGTANGISIAKKLKKPLKVFVVSCC